MYRVNNQKAVRRLADRSFRAGRSRNIIVVLAIALTALLFTALFTVGSGLIENLQRQTMRQAGGDGMAVLKYITDEEYEAVKDHSLIKDISYNRLLSSSVDNEELLKRHGELYYMDETGIRLGFCEPVEGTVPQAEDDLMMDTKTAKLLGSGTEGGRSGDASADRAWAAGDKGFSALRLVGGGSGIQCVHAGGKPGLCGCTQG